jgi:peroxiredoxin
MKSAGIRYYIFLAAFMAGSCHYPVQKKAASSFNLTGSLEGSGQGMYIYLDRLTPDGITPLDSALIGKEGRFSFHTTGIYKGFYNIRLTSNNYATLILDSGETVNFTASSDDLGYTWSASGSPDSKSYKILNRESAEYHAALDSLQSRAQAKATAMGGNPRRLDSLNMALEAPFDSIHSLHQRFILKFIHDNLTYFSAMAAIEQLPPDKFLAVYIRLDSALSAKYPSSVYTNHFHRQVTAFRRTAIGAVLPDFNLPGENGKFLSPSSLKGKTALLFFWSSASRASLAALPAVAATANKFKSNRFIVLGISFDRDKDAWLNALNRYKFAGANVCDTTGRNSKLFELYNIRSLPYNMLISPDGIIIDKNIPAEDLEEEIKQALQPIPEKK